LRLISDVYYELNSCTWKGQYIKANVSWSEDCNTCTCVNGHVRCTNVWCGPRNCRESPELCLGHQVCVPAPIENCLAPGCAPWGECRSLGPGYGSSLPQQLPGVPAPTDCWPNQAVLSAHCARLNLLLDRSKLKPGTSVEAVCGHLREIAATHQTITGNTNLLVILCEMKTGFNNIIEVTVVSSTLEISNSFLSVIY
jgi:jagged-1